MNPMNGPVGAPALWQEARNTDGRVYYYNVQTKATQWAKPVELMTPVEVRTPNTEHTNGFELVTITNFSLQRALANQPYKEYTADNGRKYWYHTETKQSTWEMPEVYKTALAQAPASPAPPVA